MKRNTYLVKKILLVFLPFFCRFYPQTKLRYEQTAVAITQEAEVVCEGIVVHFVPIAFEKCAHKKQERRLRLVEISYEHLHYLVVKAWCNDDLRAGMES